MIRKRTSKVLAAWFDIARKFGATTMSFDESTGVFRGDPNARWRMWLNFCLMGIWGQATLFIMAEFYVEGDFQRFNVAWVYMFAGSFLGIMNSVENIFPDDCLQLYNAIFGLMRHIQSKHKYLYFLCEK